ncbi:MAG: ferritin-like domain-containing protein [Solirubrobacteraceae bacterium]
MAPELATIKIHGVTRQAFLMRSALAAGAAYGALSATPYITKALAQDEVDDVAILNFALTLEYLEAEYYMLGVKQVNGLSGDEKKLATELRDNEIEHVDALKATVEKLEGTPVDKPEFDFGNAFSSRDSFLKTSNTLEDTGVSASNGAGPLIESGEVLSAAGSIVQVEARHAALVRLLRNEPPAPQAFDTASDMDAVLKAVQPFIVS